MAFENLLNYIRRVRQNLSPEARRERALRLALDQIALSKLRVQTRGEDANNSKFADYVPPYKKERQAAGYQIGFVDFTRTGQFWAGITPEIVEETPFSVTVQITSRNQRGKDIIRGASPKRLNPTLPSKQEIQLTREANSREVLKAFQL